ncbi:hypothetical protein [Xylophilus sp. Leaf220]|uniref:hypothetical protein n=1 Tax=Xylophilus sp. Leaf220 TaxID=1735686 RepID=UPI0006F776A1|nr:hypothetical protein [Xylophilus sp. Leaf220]KQM75671.1 hypothetical protein ASE76_07075 [Xylophilus sp. Leaf220]
MLLRFPSIHDRSCLLRRRAASWCLLVLLVLAPWLGQLHAVVHPAVPQGTTGLQHTAAPQGAGAVAAHGHAGGTHGLQRLFGTHDAGDCRVYDQLLHADALPSAPPLVVSVAWTAVRFAVPPQPSPSCGSAVFEARAPPAAR